MLKCVGSCPEGDGQSLEEEPCFPPGTRGVGAVQPWSKPLLQVLFLVQMMLLVEKKVEYAFPLSLLQQTYLLFLSVWSNKKKKSNPFFLCPAAYINFHGGLLPWAPQNIFVSCVTEGDKRGEGISVQIHTTWSTATLQNRRWSSVTLCLFLVLRAPCPPYNPVLVSELSSPRIQIRSLGPCLLLECVMLLQVKKLEICDWRADLKAVLLAWEIGHHDVIGHHP